MREGTGKIESKDYGAFFVFVGKRRMGNLKGVSDLRIEI